MSVFQHILPTSFPEPIAAVGSKRLDSLRSMCFWDCGVRGEVLLWGTVVEHEHGWRAQFAYPKTLHLPSNTLPVRLAEIESGLQSLVPYRCDISSLTTAGEFHSGAESVVLTRRGWIS